MDVKQPGIYKTRDGRSVEVYSFYNGKDGPETFIAEGYFTDSRIVGFWVKKDGTAAFQKEQNDPNNDLVEYVGPTPNE